jgi:hypothetical protein
MTTTIADYYQPGWREQLHTCPACDWQGNSRAMEMELHDEQTEYACPGCEMPLLIVLHPGIEQIRAAAEAGNAEAREQLDLIAAYHQRD